jgi:hypothetical protein
MTRDQKARKFTMFRGKEIETLLIPNFCHRCGSPMSHHLDKSGTIYIGCPKKTREMKKQ